MEFQLVDQHLGPALLGLFLGLNLADNRTPSFRRSCLITQSKRNRLERHVLHSGRMWSMEHDNLNRQIRLRGTEDSRSLGRRMSGHIEMGGAKRRWRIRQICRPENMHLRPTTESEDTHNRVRTISKEDAGTKRIVDLARLDIFENREHKKIKLRIPPSDNHPRRRSSREIIRPEHPQQSIAHEHVVILPRSLRTNHVGAIVPEPRRRNSRVAGASISQKSSAKSWLFERW